MAPTSSMASEEDGVRRRGVRLFDPSFKIASSMSFRDAMMRSRSRSKEAAVEEHVRQDDV